MGMLGTPAGIYVLCLISLGLLGAWAYDALDRFREARRHNANHLIGVWNILVDYRIWEGQMSHRTGERLDNAFRLMRRFLADGRSPLAPPGRTHRLWRGPSPGAV